MATTEKVIVVGAGLMGTGIAHAFATRGYDVVLIDSNPEAATTAIARIANIVNDGIRLGKLQASDFDSTIARLTPAVKIDAQASDAVLLVETATEKLDIKQQIMRQADETLPKGAILATNTSALSISEIAAVTSRAPDVVGMHFFNPVHKMKLVEIVRGIETSSQTVERTKIWSEAIGKNSVVVNEAPGFSTSRMSALAGNEAMYMLSEGVACAEDIDMALRLAYNHPMGPLELGDLTGWDTRLSVLHYLHQTLGEKFRPCPLIIKMVKAGRYGRKAGRGVYAYDPEGNKIPGSGLKVH